MMKKGNVFRGHIMADGCPFCGYREHLVVDGCLSEGYWVICINCSATGPKGETPEETWSNWSSRCSDSDGSESLLL